MTVHKLIHHSCDTQVALHGESTARSVCACPDKGVTVHLIGGCRHSTMPKAHVTMFRGHANCGSCLNKLDRETKKALEMIGKI